MTQGVQAAADALTGAVVASAVEPDTGAPAPAAVHEAPAVCRNCARTLTGPYCAGCGQHARLRRSLASLGHDLVQALLQFDGKFWRTVPELVLHPGRLTRRYIEGERAKFISPTALYLFSVFLMYAAFSLTGGPVPDAQWSGVPGVADFQAGNRSVVETVAQGIEELRGELDNPELSAERRAEIEREIGGLQSSQAVLDALARGDWDRVQEIQATLAGNDGDSTADSVPDGAAPVPDSRWARGIKEITSSPGLLSYRLQTNGYKYAWALVPLSIPFVWLLFFWRRGLHMYDHAVFVTYSISFMMLLLSLTAFAQAAGVSALWIGVGLQVVPPVHMYRQLRGAYGLSRSGAVVRLFFLLIAAAVVLTVFISLLFVIGLMG